MPDGALESAHRGAGIDALPEKVRRIEVRANDGADGPAQLEERLGIVDDEAGMHFQPTFDAVLLEERSRSSPNTESPPHSIGNRESPGNPAARGTSPSWASCRRGAPPGQPLNVMTTPTPSLFARLNGFAEIALERRGHLSFGCTLVPGAGERGDVADRGEDGHPRSSCALAVARQQRIDRTMVGARIAARAEFDGLDAKAGQVIERALKFQGTQDDGEDADFQICPYGFASE